MVRQAARERRVLALGRLKTGEMNKTEAAYAERLRALQAAGEVQWHRFEGITHYRVQQVRGFRRMAAIPPQAV
ncbi:hypothetical protein NAH03_02450 [Stenotrophomonas maltophilia]|uniref:hypothetical protein n=1 Tax=Stenotrophomonas maltophilia TaxID=40324 RepID=UPI00225C2D78|nr:hypothetical protein [Stenotrophomonas maltophilia]